jgi:hypothetical protein
MACGDVHRPPYDTVRSLAKWCIDLWPYINGKAIMNGVRLKDLDASDLMDVIHYLFEEDIYYVSKEQGESREKTRKMIYNEFYKKEYEYSLFEEKQNFDFDTIGPEENVEEIKPFDISEKSRKIKPFVPATSMDEESPMPFGRIIDAPLSH